MFCIFYCRSLNSYSAVHYTLVVIAYLGFLFFDLLYIAVTINYCSQCQLLTYYIENIQEKVRNKKYKSLNLAIKVNNSNQLSPLHVCMYHFCNDQ